MIRSQLLPQLLPPQEDPPQLDELLLQECDELEELQLCDELDEQLWLECEECPCEWESLDDEASAAMIAANDAPASSPLRS